MPRYTWLGTSGAPSGRPVFKPPDAVLAGVSTFSLTSSGDITRTGKKALSSVLPYRLFNTRLFNPRLFNTGLTPNGTQPFLFSSSGTTSAVYESSGDSVFTVTSIGNLTSAGEAALAGSAAIEFTSSGDLSSEGVVLLTGATNSVLGSSGDLTAVGDAALSGGSPFDFTSTADLSTFGLGALSGASGFDVVSQAVLSVGGTVALSGSSSFDVTSSGNIAPAGGILVVRLTWTDVSTTNTSQIISRSTDGGTIWDENFATVGADVETFDDTNVVEDGSYCYKVRARNATGDSADTIPVCVKVIRNHIVLTWDDNSNDEDGFIISRQVDDGIWDTNYVTVGPDVTVYNDYDLVLNSKYCYQVRAYNTNGESSNTLTECTAFTPGVNIGLLSGNSAFAFSSSASVSVSGEVPLAGGSVFDLSSFADLTGTGFSVMAGDTQLDLSSAADLTGVGLALLSGASDFELTSTAALSQAGVLGLSGLSEFTLTTTAKLTVNLIDLTPSDNDVWTLECEGAWTPKGVGWTWR